MSGNLFDLNDEVAVVIGATGVLGGALAEGPASVGAAVFLASPRASGFVTGIDLRVDGGFLSQTI